ncbi:MAG: sulfite exporter TauE/SafE family protein [Anaerolineae bacterium]|nr:sulfite exporter TauE/SafE family protein [Anaerolineae bacterium]
MMHGFLLGLANGASCLAFCAPVLVPFFLSENRNVKDNLIMLLKFLGGRLIGYLIFGLLAWIAGRLIGGLAAYQSLLYGAAYIGFSVLLVAGVLIKPKKHACALHTPPSWLANWPVVLPIAMGFLAGLKVCPPMLLAFTSAASTGSLLDSLAFFITFFIGTCVYFVPIIFVGAFRHIDALPTIGRFAAVMIAVYYTFSGFLMLTGGISQL